MKFSIQFLSFFVIHQDSQEQDPIKRYKHYQTLDHFGYEDSEIKSFLDSEFTRIGKRKAEVHSETDNAPTKIGRFILEPGHELDSNPNYNLFRRLREAADKQQFHATCDDMLRIYMDTSAVRGGAFIVASAKLNELFDEPFVFVLKCDFESKIARVSDERSLISKVEMAISARNIKSIQYPHMPEEGMLEPFELKIHQASHARYFEDFLKYVTYEKSKPEIVTDQVLGMVQQYMDSKWQGDFAPGAAPVPVPAYEASRESEAGEGAELPEQPQPLLETDPYETQRSEPLSQASGSWSPERRREESQLEVWAAGEKRQLQEKWTHEDVAQATAQLTEYQPELDLKFKLDEIAVKGKLAHYGDCVHFARMNGRYVVLIEGDTFQFEKGLSPVELLYPDEIDEVLRRMDERQRSRRSERDDDMPY
ncbi:DUF3900 domain-containing protein [Cohnella zeiphila]|uniref:DUF3900 domain-containing protein n=1 Tax=Cohnella zeiphila TaxID=2761120 RepID=A0A7X0SQA6_9BACL|nr:DUF3900 domain-containing protein [Cohnella zeiphila]MBB6733109.1 DUF3900 domain-containing protein [Cohnella zeiphila]